MVEVYFRMPKAEFDTLLIQMGRRIHRLRGELNNLSLKGRTLDPQMRSDLSIMELLRERLKANVRLVNSDSPYEEPQVDYSLPESERDSPHEAE